jgi:hypothetical protein
MSIEANHPIRRRAPRLWIVESLIVVGVLAFGYFAITMDASFFGAPPAGLPTDPLTELLR